MAQAKSGPTAAESVQFVCNVLGTLGIGLEDGPIRPEMLLAAKKNESNETLLRCLWKVLHDILVQSAAGFGLNRRHLAVLCGSESVQAFQFSFVTHAMELLNYPWSFGPDAGSRALLLALAWLLANLNVLKFGAVVSATTVDSSLLPPYPTDTSSLPATVAAATAEAARVEASGDAMQAQWDDLNLSDRINQILQQYSFLGMQLRQLKSQCVAEAKLLHRINATVAEAQHSAGKRPQHLTPFDLHLLLNTEALREHAEALATAALQKQQQHALVAHENAFFAWMQGIIVLHEQDTHTELRKTAAGLSMASTTEHSDVSALQHQVHEQFAALRVQMERIRADFRRRAANSLPDQESKAQFQKTVQAVTKMLPSLDKWEAFHLLQLQQQKHEDVPVVMSSLSDVSLKDRLPPRLVSDLQTAIGGTAPSAVTSPVTTATTVTGGDKTSDVGSRYVFAVDRHGASSVAAVQLAQLQDVAARLADELRAQRDEQNAALTDVLQTFSDYRILRK